MDKLKLSTAKEFSESKSYVVGPCMLMQGDDKVGRIIHRVVLSNDEKELAISMGTRIVFYPITENPVFHNKRGTITFTSYDTTYTIRATVASDAKWHLKAKGSVEQIHEAYDAGNVRVITLPVKKQAPQGESK